LENVSINDLKLKGLRATIDVEKDGETRQVHIFDILNEDREEFLQKIAEDTEEDYDGDEKLERYYELIFDRCVEGIDLDGNITDAFINPTLEMMEIRTVLEEMIAELHCQVQLGFYYRLLETEMNEYTEQNIAKIDDVKGIQDSIDKIYKNIESNKKIIEDNSKIYLEELEKQAKISELIKVETAKGTIEKARELDKILEENEKLGIDIEVSK
jgi:hypothetical protein